MKCRWFHKWGEWQDAVRYQGGFMVQSRQCSRCNKESYRTVKVK